jgi:hypothetical protein
MNITKEVKDLYKDNYKALKKEMKEHTRTWKDFLSAWIGRIKSSEFGYTTNSNLRIQSHPHKNSQ